MNIYQLLSGLKKSRRGIGQIYKMTSLLMKSGKFILIFIIIAFGSGELYAQHLFSVNYNNLSQENARNAKGQVTSSVASIKPLTRGIKGEYNISLSTSKTPKSFF